MRPEDFRSADFKTALKIFSTKVAVWVKLAQCVPRDSILHALNTEKNLLQNLQFPIAKITLYNLDTEIRMWIRVEGK